MPSVNDFLESAGMIAVFNAIIFFAGRAMLKSMKRKGYLRRAFHGWYVWVWMMGGVMVGGCLCAWGFTLPQYRGAPLMMGFVVGWIGGTFHGFSELQKVGESLPDEPNDDDE